VSPDASVRLVSVGQLSRKAVSAVRARSAETPSSPSVGPVEMAPLLAVGVAVVEDGAGAAGGLIAEGVGTGAVGRGVGAVGEGGMDGADGCPCGTTVQAETTSARAGPRARHTPR
jgi:hypothetical protein